MVPMPNWERDDLEQYCARIKRGCDDRYFLAHTENNYKAEEE